MAETINKGLDKVKDSVTSTGDGITNATEYVGDKYTGRNCFLLIYKYSVVIVIIFYCFEDAKESVKDTSSSTYNKVEETLKDGIASVGDGFATVGDFISDKYDGKNLFCCWWVFAH